MNFGNLKMDVNLSKLFSSFLFVGVFINIVAFFLGFILYFPIFLYI